MVEERHRALASATSEVIAETPRTVPPRECEKCGLTPIPFI